MRGPTTPAAPSPVEIDDARTAPTFAERVEAACRIPAGKLSGIATARAIGEFFEQELFDCYDATLGRRGPVRSDHAVVLVGGTGRGELCPHSDADLLILKRSGAGGGIDGAIESFVRKVWDRGLRLGHSVRTVAETLRDCREDVKLAAALTDARHLAGDPGLTERLRHGFVDLVTRRRTRAFVDACVATREKEREAFGGTACLLEPDVKKGPGGLRDVHMIGWIGFARHATTDLEGLVGCGLLARGDYRTLREAVDLLLRVRIALHRAAGRDQDLFPRDEQARLAAEWDVEAPAGMLPVEALMKTYFRAVTAVRDIADRVVDRHRPRSLRSRVTRRVLLRRVERTFLLGPRRVEVVATRLETVLASPASLVRLFEFVAANGEVRLEPRLEAAIAATVGRLPDEVPADASAAFLRLLAHDGALGTALRAMHRVGLLSYFIPEFEHARGLTQFSEYHSYTVDEHTLRAVERSVAFVADEGPVGAAARSADDVGLLRLALLLHDVGKGLGGDHSEVGAEIAARVAGRLGLDGDRAETVVFLVREHLTLAHAAFRRDTNDPALLGDLARRVGDAGTLRLLFVLTACDLAGVGPGVWTDWKQELLTNLYDRVTGVLSGRPPAGDGSETARRRDGVLELAREGALDDATRARFATRVEQLSGQYFAAVRRRDVLADLLELERIAADPAARPTIAGTFDPETRTTAYRVIAGPAHADGCFAKTTGAFAAKRLRIHEAVIESTPDGIVLDRYRVSDDDFVGRPPGWRIQDICRTIEDALTGRVSVPKMLGGGRYGTDEPSLPAAWSTPRVSIDNALSTGCTILDVFTVDRPGLLCRLATTLQRLELSVELAKISTHLDQVVDVFYVTESGGGKVTDPERLATVRGELEAAIAEPAEKASDSGVGAAG